VHTLGGEGTAEAQVLVVDDDPAMCRLTALALERAGYGVVTAAHGGRALELLDEAAAGHVHPRVILLDMGMAVVDGWAFCRAYGPAGHRPPIVVFTAGGDGAACAAAVGAAAFLNKPFDLDELVTLVERYAV
jgi:CheY-like chemotaxis protein